MGEIVPRQHPLDPLDCREEIGHLGLGEVCQPLVWLYGADEDVAWEQRLEVDQGKGVWGGEEDLRGWLVLLFVPRKVACSPPPPATFFLPPSFAGLCVCE